MSKFVADTAVDCTPETRPAALPTRGGGVAAATAARHFASTRARVCSAVVHATGECADCSDGSDCAACLSTPAAPSTPLPLGLSPVLNATLAANDTADYVPTPFTGSDVGLRAANPAQRFATTFRADGVAVASASGSAWPLRATEIATEAGAIPLSITTPIVAGSRVEYRRDGVTEWYINGPRGLEQGFAIAAPPSGAAVFTIGLAVTGDLSLPVSFAMHGNALPPGKPPGGTGTGPHPLPSSRPSVPQTGNATPNPLPPSR